MRSAQRNLCGELALGALAGLAATWVMGKATTYLYEHEDEGARQRENQARGGKTAYETAAERAAGLADRQLSDEERKKLGSLIHWGLGSAGGAMYVLLRRRLAGRGLGADLAASALFGTAVWLLLDEGANPVLGLTPGPRAFPWQTHARGLAGHLVLGVATEGLMQAADRVA